MSMTTTTRTPSRLITDEVTSWPGVEAGPGERGEFAFTVGRREIGHLHGDRVAHFGFPKTIGARLREEGRIGSHPVFPENPGWGARSLLTDDDVHDVIELMRLNYDRAVAKRGFPGLRPSEPTGLPFAPDLHVRAFLLEREAGDLLVYSAPEAPRGATRQYLNHWHEARFAPGAFDAPLFVHEHDREATERSAPVAHVFQKRHMLGDDFEVIPTPGHTPGATAYLWDSGEHRFLFTGDTIYLDDGEWVAAVLDSSDRAAYVESLETIRALDFDVLVPWGASAGQPWYARTNADDRGRRLDAIIERVRHGESR
jgi:hypothetical protein